MPTRSVPFHHMGDIAVTVLRRPAAARLLNFFEVGMSK
jgi:hypothetical protein